MYTHLFGLERVLDRQASYLRSWNLQDQPVFFPQQLRNESFQIGLSELQARVEKHLIELTYAVFSREVQKRQRVAGIDTHAPWA